MEIFSVLGLLVGTIMVVYGMISGGSSLGLFVSPSSFCIVLGGTMGALCISYPLSMIKQIPAHFKLVFMKNNFNPAEYIEQIVELARVARKSGLLALEDTAEKIENTFLSEGILLIVDGIEAERVKKILDNKIDYTLQRHEYAITFYERASALAPAFGMIGTVIGLIQMLADLSAADPNKMAQGMSTALITTLYGSLLANLIFTPIANKLQVLHEQEVTCLELVMEGILSIQAGENPKHIEEKLHSYLPEAMRGDMDMDSGGEALEA